jgi:hypothetical protein
MGQVGNGLDYPFKQLVPHFVEKQGKDNRGGEAEEEIVKTDENGIPQKADEVGAVEKPDEMYKSYPFTVGKAPGRGKVFKGDKGAVHGLIAKEGVKQQNRQYQKVQGPVSFHVPAKGLCIFFHRNTPGNPADLSTTPDFVVRSCCFLKLFSFSGRYTG